MLSVLKNYIYLFGLMFSCLGYTQTYSISLTIIDELENPVENAEVVFYQDRYLFHQTSDAHGYLKVEDLSAGWYTLNIQHEGYAPISRKIDLFKPLRLQIQLNKHVIELKQIVVTAKENKGLVTASKIDQQALEHLQPSSFTDIFELLPGGKAKDPDLTRVNPIKIREFIQPNHQYATSSLGVQFLMDGTPLNSAADLQISVEDPLSVYNNNPYAITSRNTYNTGVDTRTISTNDIESVEVIRGIPTAAYGDLTSGLIKVKRKSGKTQWQSRLKIDGFSKSFYIAKGFKMAKDWDINTSVDYLDAKADPRNVNENYKRFATSIRSKVFFKLGENKLKWQSNIDYNISIDDETIDPDTGYKKIDAYENKKQNISLTNLLSYKITHSFIDKLQFNTSVRQGIHDLNQTKWIQFSGPRAISIATQPGVNNGYFPEIRYTSFLKTEGRPLDIYSQLSAWASFVTNHMQHKIETGINYNYSKNNGRGQIYDILKPPSPSMSTRPRAFNDIPAYQNLAFYIGDHIDYKLNQHQWSLYAGARLSKVLGLEKRYSLSHKIYLEPRFNLQWKAPSLSINQHPLNIDITLGYGELYKQPTLYMLYPNKIYLDFQQLNFYHYNPALRYVNYMTYVEDVTNYNLKAAKNVKKEIRLDLSYNLHNFFITYFLEDMKSGFRTQNHFKTFYYNRYDASGVDLDQITEAPNINDLPFEQRYSFLALTTHQNGSRTYKKGIEFGYSSPRFKSINTRITMNGAWFKTLYENTSPYHEKPNISLGGISFPYVGIYKNDTGYINEGINYNCIIDTYLENLGMNISMSLQGTLFLNKSRTKRIAEPYAYYDKDGNLYQFTEQDKTDTYKQWLVRNVSSTDNMATRYPYDIVANIKATKRIYSDLKASLFVNRLFSYYAPYKFNDVTVERNFWNEPYFGMELTFNFK